jgi:predicted nucleic acid-binding protein
LDSGDTYHADAARVLTAENDLVITDHVLVETWGLIAHRLGVGVADRYLDDVLAGAARVEIVGMADIARSVEVRHRYSDQEMSLVDCTSFVVMERLRLSRVATFDHHFAIHRYGRDRRQAFEILR